MGGKSNLHNMHAAFGDTDRAGCIPDCLAPQAGPTYIEGKLVLSLSFQGDSTVAQHSDDACASLERYRLWDDQASVWYDSKLEILRFEHSDIVRRSGSSPVTLWKGAVDTHARVIPELELGDSKTSTYHTCDLCWKRV